MSLIDDAQFFFELGRLQVTVQAAAETVQPEAEGDDYLPIFEQATNAPDQWKELLRGSILELEGDKWAIIEKKSIIKGSTAFSLQIRLGGGKAEQKDEAWLNDNVKGIYLGVSTYEGGSGKNSLLDVKGSPSTMTPDLTGSGPLTTMSMRVGGGSLIPKPVAEALKLAGADTHYRLWAGGHLRLGQTRRSTSSRPQTQPPPTSGSMLWREEGEWRPCTGAT